MTCFVIGKMKFKRKRIVGGKNTPLSESFFSPKKKKKICVSVEFFFSEIEQGLTFFSKPRQKQKK